MRDQIGIDRPTQSVVSFHRTVRDKLALVGTFCNDRNVSRLIVLYILDLGAVASAEVFVPLTLSREGPLSGPGVSRK